MNVRRAVRRGAFLLMAAALTSCLADHIAGSGTWAIGTSQHFIVVGELTRDYILHVPAHRPVNAAGAVRAYPLVIMLHGSSGSAADFRTTTQMDTLSELSRYLVVYANGVQGGGGLYPTDWNAGPNCCGAAGREGIDDVGFISAVIKEVGKNLALDTLRVYVAGFSDGGRLAHHLACQLSPKLAAIAVVSGSMEDDNCVPTKPVPVIAFHGTNDDQVSYGAASLTPPSVAQTGVTAALPPSVQFWIARDGCTKITQTKTAADIFRSTFTTCTGAEVAFYTIIGGVHGWPGDPGGAGSQPPMSEVKASSLISDFFGKQVRR